jgi:hypothetical protein
MYRVVITSMLLLADLFLLGCSARSDLTGSYSAPLTATSPDGQHWSGSTDLLLSQQGQALTGILWIHHPEAGTIRVPIVTGIATSRQVSFEAHGEYTLGTVDVVFQGSESHTKIAGTAQLTLHTLLGSLTEKADVDLRKTRQLMTSSPSDVSASVKSVQPVPAVHP